MFLKPEKLTLKDKTNTINELLDYSSPTWDFYLMQIVAAIFISVGLLMDNSTVMISGALVGPMLFPILSLAMGVVVGYQKLIHRGFAIITKSAILTMIIGFLTAFFFNEATLHNQIISHAETNLIFFYIAILSGAGVAYSLARPNLSASLPSIAFAVSLLPPLAVTGISLAFLRIDLMLGALTMFIFNLAGIMFSAIVIFSAMSFHQMRSLIKEKLKKEDAVLKTEKKEFRQLENKTVKAAKEIITEVEKKLKA